MRVGVEGGITLEIDVDCGAAIDFVAFGCTCQGIVRVKGGVAHVSSLRVGCIEIGKGERIPERNWSLESLLCKVWILFERIVCVRAADYGQ